MILRVDFNPNIFGRNRWHPSNIKTALSQSILRLRNPRILIAPLKIKISNPKMKVWFR